jgi:Ca2+-binding RTX toxin-like protein
MSREFQVNTYEEGWQESPQVVVFANGSFEILWDSIDFRDTPVADYFVAAQRYSAEGVRVGGERLIYGSADDAAREVTVARLKDGGYAVTFDFSEGGILEYDVVAGRVLNADGSVRTGPLRIDSPPATATRFYEDNDTAIAPLANGGFMAIYRSDGRGDGGIAFQDVFARVFTANGQPLGRDVRLNTNEIDLDHGFPKVTEIVGGRFLVTWASEASFPRPGAINGDGNELRGSLFDGNGRLLRSDFRMTETFGSAVSGISNAFDVIALKSGGFMSVHFELEAGLRGRPTVDQWIITTYDAFGRVIAPQRVVLESLERGLANPSLVQLATGEIILAYEGSSKDGFFDYQYDVRAMVLDARGRPISGEYELAENRFDSQEEVDIAALPGGGFVATWQSEDIDGVREGVAARVFGRGTGGDDVARVDILASYSGLAGNDRIFGDARANVLNGGSGNDVLVGYGGNDTLIGSLGVDAMTGGFGNDLYFVDDPRDRIAEALGGGYDRVISSVSFTLGAHLERLDLAGAAVTGVGNAGANVLVGNAVGNRLFAGAGNDVLNGGRGIDTLLGGAGDDAFVFNTPGIFANRDVITDFNVGNDTIRLENTGAGLFTALPAGVLAAAAFKLIGPGGGAIDASDRILYNKANGWLYYDADGDPNGAAAGSGLAPVLIAVLANRPVVSASDIVVF